MAEVRNVGFYNMGISLPERELNLDINVWYPTDSRRRRPYKLQSWSFRAAGKTAVSPGSWPLILLSHPSSGNRLTHHNTASDLAARGFIVAVMTHPFDNLDSMPDLYSWDLFVHRARDLRLLLDIILNHEHFAQSIDRERIGVLGFGAGGAAALLVGGALPDCTLWDTFCTGSDLRNPYCNSWAKNRIDKNICPALPLKHSLADVRVKACALVEPGFSMLFSHDALAWFYPPVLLVRRYFRFHLRVTFRSIGPMREGLSKGATSQAILLTSPGILPLRPRNIMSSALRAAVSGRIITPR